MTDATINTNNNINSPAIPDTMTPAEAATALTQRSTDKDWSARVTGGDGPATAEFHALVQRKHQADRISAVLDGTATPVDFELTTEGRLNTAKLIQGVANLREIGVEEKPLRDFMTDTPITKKDLEWVKQYEKQLLTNSEFVNRYLSGDAAAVKEMTTVRMHRLRPVADK